MLKKIVTDTGITWNFGSTFNVFIGDGIKTRLLKSLIATYNYDEKGYQFEPNPDRSVDENCLISWHDIQVKSLDTLVESVKQISINGTKQFAIPENGYGILGVITRLMRDDGRINDILKCLMLVDCDVSQGTLSTILSPLTHYNNYVSDEFLYVLFYATMIVSPETSNTFAAEEFDAKLNIKVCTHLTKLLIELCKKYNKQMFVTANNPAVLDAIDLNDTEQGLFIITLNKHKADSVRLNAEDKPKSSRNEPMKLSEAYMRGYLVDCQNTFKTY